VGKVLRTNARYFFGVAGASCFVNLMVIDFFSPEPSFMNSVNVYEVGVRSDTTSRMDIFFPAGWTVPMKLTRPAGVSSWRDIDLTWDEAARGFMVALPLNGGNQLWFTPLYGAQPWSEWRFFDTRLWAPGAAVQNAPALQSITASRWMEDPAGTTTPVIFGTDDNGNIYFIEFAREGSPAGWILNWKSFYHETIPLP
jgi:hypothetical protein